MRYTAVNPAWLIPQLPVTQTKFYEWFGTNSAKIAEVDL